MSAHTERHHSPDDQLIAFENVARRITCILRHQDDVGPALAQALADRFAIHCSDHDMPVFGSDRTIHHSHITIENSCPLHAVPLDSNGIDMRRTDVQQLVNGDVLLKMISRR